MRRRAGNETRTRDPNLGKVVLYQLSYSRISIVNDANIHVSQGICQTDFLTVLPSPFMANDLVFSTGLCTHGYNYVWFVRTAKPTDMATGVHVDNAITNKHDNSLPR